MAPLLQLADRGSPLSCKKKQLRQKKMEYGHLIMASIVLDPMLNKDYWGLMLEIYYLKKNRYFLKTISYILFFSLTGN